MSVRSSIGGQEFVCAIDAIEFHPEIQVRFLGCETKIDLCFDVYHQDIRVL